MRRLLLLVALSFSLPARAVTIDWAEVGNPNNAPDTPSTNCLDTNTSCGSVGYAYFISKHEVTNAQYAEFLNAKAGSDPSGLYNPSMGSDPNAGGITQSGVSGSYTYTAKAGFENKPVVYVSFYDALRFANWLNNGQGSGDTETGAYTITADGITANSITRNPGAITFLPSENEWYKAAYYSPGGVYFEYPAGTDTPTVCAAPTATANRANCHNNSLPWLTDVGAYTGSASPYGTFDQGGNVAEWNEQIPYVAPNDLDRGFRGGFFGSYAVELAASAPNGTSPDFEFLILGFRVASLVPEPDTALLVMTGVLGLAASRRRRANESSSRAGTANVTRERVSTTRR